MLKSILYRKSNFPACRCKHLFKHCNEQQDNQPQWIGFLSLLEMKHGKWDLQVSTEERSESTRSHMKLTDLSINSSFHNTLTSSTYCYVSANLWTHNVWPGASHSLPLSPPPSALPHLARRDLHHNMSTQQWESKFHGRGHEERDREC